MLTNKGKYGLKAMVYLAGCAPGEPALVTDIAVKNNIPKKFLDSILGELRNAGVVHSKKGRGGGYVLAKPAGEIMVGQIIRTLDGPLAPIHCASRIFYRRCDDCADESTCALRAILSEAHEAAIDALEKRTLAEAIALADLQSSEQGKFGPDVFMGAFI